MPVLSAFRSSHNWFFIRKWRCETKHRRFMLRVSNCRRSHGVILPTPYFDTIFRGKTYIRGYFCIKFQTILKIRIRIWNLTSFFPIKGGKQSSDFFSLVLNGFDRFLSNIGSISKVHGNFQQIQSSVPNLCQSTMENKCTAKCCLDSKKKLTLKLVFEIY